MFDTSTMQLVLAVQLQHACNNDVYRVKGVVIGETSGKLICCNRLGHNAGMAVTQAAKQKQLASRFAIHVCMNMTAMADQELSQWKKVLTTPVMRLQWQGAQLLAQPGNPAPVVVCTSGLHQ